jgi:hypothetical protein
MGQLHGAVDDLAAGGIGDALIERHDEVGPQSQLDFDSALRGKEVGGTVQVRLEPDTILGNPPEGLETHHLEASAVRQDGAGPRHEAVQPAQTTDHLVARP